MRANDFESFGGYDTDRTNRSVAIEAKRFGAMRVGVAAAVTGFCADLEPPGYLRFLFRHLIFGVSLLRRSIDSDSSCVAIQYKR
jgi:hypothetical protein